MGIRTEGRAGGDLPAFEGRCLAFLGPIFNYVRASVASAADAEDLTQDVFHRAFACRGQFTGGDLKAWLYRIARNRIAMHYRRLSVERRGLAVLSARARSAACGEPAPGPAADEEPLRRAALEAIAALDETEGEVIRLKFSGACGNVEIARLLAVTPGHLGVILFRALKKIRRALEADGGACESERRPVMGGRHSVPDDHPLERSHDGA